MASTRPVRRTKAASSKKPARTTKARKKTASASPARKKPTAKKWSQHVTETSDAMTLEPSVFKLRSARAIAASLKRSVERSHRRKSPPYRSAMSMLTFYMNRGGSNLSAAEKRRLEQAKDELRKLFGKE
jgi:hypothetical protein